MTIYDLKPRFQNALRPIADRLAARGVTANQVTLAAALGSILLGGAGNCLCQAVSGLTGDGASGEGRTVRRTAPAGDGAMTRSGTRGSAMGHRSVKANLSAGVNSVVGVTASRSVDSSGRKASIGKVRNVLPSK